MIAPQIILLHREESQEALNRERLARYAISPMIDDECNIVELQKHTEIEKRSMIAHGEHGCLCYEETTSDRDIVPAFSKDYFVIDSRSETACNDDQVAYVCQDVHLRSMNIFLRIYFSLSFLLFIRWNGTKEIIQVVDSNNSRESMCCPFMN